MATTSKGKARSAEPKKLKSTVGAPLQPKQSSRKGKKAWRKNVDVEDVEEVLEELRAEERVTGSTLHKKSDTDLFQIDLTGDAHVRKSLPKFSMLQLSANKILSQRSAVPVVLSRVSTSSSKRKASGVSREDKDRLLRIAKRPRKGPFNTIIDPTEPGQGSAIAAISEAVKNSGTYDAWAPVVEANKEDEVFNHAIKIPVKPPQHKHPRQNIDAPAVPAPHQGASYNPPAVAHQDLLLQAHTVEEKRVNELERYADLKKRMDLAQDDVAAPEGVPSGMKLDLPTEVADSDVEDDSTVITRSQPAPKTQQQRRKAAKLLEEKRALAEKAAKRKLHGTIDNAKVLRKQTKQQLAAQEEAVLLRRLTLQEKLKKGLGGQKLGKHKVPAEDIDVQLGDDLTESLRALKPEGNLFKDRFLSLQQRALIEPRVRVLPKKQRRSVIDYEKHAWKRFDRV